MNVRRGDNTYDSMSSFISVVVPCNTEGKFGWKCKFTCHCKNGEDCDKVTGHCGSGCEEGRYGIGCQYGKAETI